MVSVAGHETSDHWLVWVRGVMFSVAGHDTSDHWLMWVRGVVNSVAGYLVLLLRLSVKSNGG